MVVRTLSGNSQNRLFAVILSIFFTILKESYRENTADEKCESRKKEYLRSKGHDDLESIR